MAFSARSFAAEPTTKPAAVPASPPATKPTAIPLPDRPDPIRARVKLATPGEKSLVKLVGPRFGFPRVSALEKLDLPAESFELFVPGPAPAKAAPASEDVPPLGLLVWISPLTTGDPPREWLEVLARRRLVWICANDAGNDRRPLERMALAVEAGEQLRARWKIDPARVFVGGTSGGGRCASMAAPMFPELFRGGYYVVGCNYFRPLPVPGDPDRSWKASCPEPEEALLDRARKSSRFVLLTGETDANRLQTLATYESGYKQDGFESATYIEVPGMGHATPDAWWFEKGVAALLGEEGPKGEGGPEKRK
ncbi:MAG: hypothetical protein NTW19_07070 [Planctomycetota bacterium]|nr:hypothetical protein [Planctomycetota bacterium]